MKLPIIYCILFGLLLENSEGGAARYCQVRNNLTVLPGVHQDPDTCGAINCYKTGMAIVYHCGTKSIAGCTEGEVVDPRKDYPECCIRYFHCQNKDGKMNIIQL
ncbi:hypothetical protein ACFFRR_002427 [Megaselia abdita]